MGALSIDDAYYYTRLLLLYEQQQQQLKLLLLLHAKQVRCSSLQELVYKQGQAGITKASVSITFNNADKSRSPVGYEHCDQVTVTRQIVIGGKNKYMINGSVAQPTRVQNLFHSVQLNVNNPHFLIMQGRITKVLNMKPIEILGMLEEAAGTRMYESKKEAAMKTLTKKELKVTEIDQLLEEEILPTIEKLRKERGEYMKWASANDTLERLRRFCVAVEFCEAEEEMEEDAQMQAALVMQEAFEAQSAPMPHLIGEGMGHACESNPRFGILSKVKPKSCCSQTTLKSRWRSAGGWTGWWLRGE